MKSQEIYRLLTSSEKEVLISNGCLCDDWSRVLVIEGFSPDSCSNVTFSGDIKLGLFNKPFTDKPGVSFSSGIKNARIHNCIIGTNVVINNIGDYIANYSIEDNVVIRNCGRIYCDGKSSFGNGLSVAVMNETGTRSVKIWDRLSAHEAYIVALYRHRTRAIEKIENMIDSYASANSSETGRIGSGSVILNCSNIRNVKFGSFSHAEGVLNLNEGSVNSNENDPVFIGQGVIMEHFIVCSGSIINKSSLIENCFIGQGCIIDKQFSAENSLFFANCEGFLGEACSVFAGPFTVTHHKSTLLLTGLFSFMNAGSGSNQSNHMYKLGPVHQGVMERGCKTGSDSYLLWPSHIGAFTLVAGSHKKNIDTASLPFSYLIESKDESILVPAINLRSVGTLRDSQKWPSRDRRKDPQRIDQINFSLLNPYTVGKIIEGRNLLIKIKAESPGNNAHIYNGVSISPSSLDRGIKLYQTAVNKYLGDSIVKRLDGFKFNTNHELTNRLLPANEKGSGKWVDLAGLIAPSGEVNNLLDGLENDNIRSIEDLIEEFRHIHSSFDNWEWTWVCEKVEEETGMAVNKLTAKNIISLVDKWKTSITDLDNQIYEDAEKEFSTLSMTGFGIDGNTEVKKLDFENVRGKLETNTVATSIHAHLTGKIALGDELIARIKKLKE